MILNVAEVASVWNVPTERTRQRIAGVPARWLRVPSQAFIPIDASGHPCDPRYLWLGMGERSDGSRAPIGIRYDLLRYPAWGSAPMGRGKTVQVKRFIDGLLKAGVGFMALGCKGVGLVNDSLKLIPLGREQDVVILDLSGSTVTGELSAPAMNMLSPRFGVSLGLKFSQLASTIIQIFVALDPKFETAPGMRQFANYGLLALLEGEPRSTLMHLIRFYGDEVYRADICSRLRPGPVKDFWSRRFDAMPDSQKSSLNAFERRLDQLLTYPELAAMLVADGCSVDLRDLMDHNGILLAGITATEGTIANLSVTLLLTQLTLAALSRAGTPNVEDADGFNPYRPDWTLIIDEFHIIAEANAEVAKVMFSQFREFRIGQLLYHQDLSQLPPEVMGPLRGNAQSRLILGTEATDAGEYESLYNALGVKAQDFIAMERFDHIYMKLYGTDAPLFSAHMLPPVEDIDEPAPPPVFCDWRTVRAHARNAEDQALDEAMARFQAQAVFDNDAAVRRLGLLCNRDPAAFEVYRQRRKAHWAAQRQFILENPGCIPLDWRLSEKDARLAQKDQRIRILSALRANEPRLETEAMSFALLLAAEEAAAARDQQAVSNPPRRSKNAGKAGKGMAAPAPTDEATPSVMIATDTSLTGIPTLDELLAARGARRAADDIAPGFEALEAA